MAPALAPCQSNARVCRPFASPNCQTHARLWHGFSTGCDWTVFAPHLRADSDTPVHESDCRIQSTLAFLRWPQSGIHCLPITCHYRCLHPVIVPVLENHELRHPLRCSDESAHVRYQCRYGLYSQSSSCRLFSSIEHRYPFDDVYVVCLARMQASYLA